LLVRPVVRVIEPYEWEESTEALARRLGLAVSDVVRYDMNTSPQPAPGLDEALDRVRGERRVNEYFDTRYTVLTEAIAAYNGVDVANVLIGAGADEALSVVVAAFIEHGRHTAMLVPTFPMCAIYTEQHGGTVRGVAYDEGFAGPVDALIAAAQGAHLVFMCSPNNPSGTALSLADLERVVEAAPCAVVVDEAYYEYHGQTVAPLIARYPHLIVLRTFSKAFGMAGARVGYALAASQTIALLNRLRPPNSVSYASVLLAQATLDRLADVRQAVDAVVREREALRAALQGLGLQVWPSQGNFLLTRVPPAAGTADDEPPQAGDPLRATRVHRHLLEQGLVLRGYRGHSRLGACLRMTVRTPRDNARMLAALTAALAADE
jgi:histidinol-phosphate aminotransferase